MMQFGEKLRLARVAAGWSMYLLAKRAGVSYQGVSKWEEGEREPTWRAVQLLSLALGISTEALRDDDVQAPVYQPGKRGRRPRPTRAAAGPERKPGRPRKAKPAG